jgi:hypothetical protein
MSNLHFIELSRYEQPVITENKREEWVDFGADNNYYGFLIDCYKNSTTNNALINAICKLIYGKGLDATDSNKKPNDYAQMKMLFRKEVLKKATTDLKLLGQFALQVIYNKKGDKIVKVEHIPVQLLRAEKCDENGDIKAYYYSDNWQDIKKFKPKRISAFGFGDKTLEILFVGNYTVGQKYYSSVDYTGAIPYCNLEHSISDYLINDVQNGFSGTKVINFNNGVPDEDKQSMIANNVMNKLTGANGLKVIVSFNNDETAKTTVDNIPLDNAPEHYAYLSEEARSKILLGHGITSGLLFGIPTANGFSSNADELKNASILFDNMVIKPFQQTIIDALNKILNFNGVALELEFVTLQPLDAQGELTDESSGNDIIEALNSLSPLVATKVLESMTPNEIRNLVLLPPKEEGSELPSATMLSKHIDEIDVDKFGETLDPKEWELVDSRPVDYETEAQLDAELEALNNPKKSLMGKMWEFVTTGVARPNAPSSQDGTFFVSRYRYTGAIKENSRDFCKKMLNANKLYRKEDIEQMSAKPSTNGEWAERGKDTYDIFLFKGGGACHHFWTRETYRRIQYLKPSGNKNEITPAQARKEGEILPTVDRRVYQKPIDMPNKGFINK